MSALFEPFKLKDVTLRNRIAVPPMCQYVAEDGVVNDWHHVHLAGIARGGAGLVIAEATAVSPEGRITPGCAGLWNDAQAEAFAPSVAAIKAAGAVPGIQIAHAGRKASANRPWEGDDHIADGDPRGWQTIAPSAVPFGAHLPKTPRAMTRDDIARVQADFVAAAKRARDLGFEWLELHFAHGYLGQSFFSVHANQRDDEYGGSAENRGRFLVETLAAVRKVWPEHLPLTARFGVIEYDGRDEETLAESIALTQRLKREGADMLSVSIGFSTPDAQIPWGRRSSRRSPSACAARPGCRCRPRGDRHAATREPRGGGGAARSRDGRPRASGRPALAVLRGQATRRRASVVDAARTVRALARALPERRQGGLSGRGAGAARASRAPPIRRRWIEWRFAQAGCLREPPFLFRQRCHGRTCPVVSQAPPHGRARSRFPAPCWLRRCW